MREMEGVWGPPSGKYLKNMCRIVLFLTNLTKSAQRSNKGQCLFLTLGTENLWPVFFCAVPKMCIWSILLLKSDLKWRSHLSGSIHISYSYFNYL